MREKNTASLTHAHAAARLTCLDTQPCNPCQRGRHAGQRKPSAKLRPKEDISLAGPLLLEFLNFASNLRWKTPTTASGTVSFFLSFPPLVVCDPSSPMTFLLRDSCLRAVLVASLCVCVIAKSGERKSSSGLGPRAESDQNGVTWVVSQYFRQEPLLHTRTAVL